MYGNRHPSSKLQILYEDNHLIAVLKPPGLLTQSDKTLDLSLMDLTRIWLTKKYQKPGNVFLGLVHRLDRPVGGVVLLAKTSKGASRISEQFRNHEVKKIYWAWVEGTPKENSKTLVHYLTWVKKKRRAWAFEQGATERQRAVLSYSGLRSEHNRTLLEVKPGTGRKHQIRAQLSSIGHPILGDNKYGAKQTYEGPGIGLFAKSLELKHPTKSEACIRIEVPDDLVPLEFRAWISRSH